MSKVRFDAEAGCTFQTFNLSLTFYWLRRTPGIDAFPHA